MYAITPPQPRVGRDIESRKRRTPRRAQQPVFRLLLNAREAFRYHSGTQQTQDWDWWSAPDVAAAVHALPAPERAAVFRYHRRGDAGLALGSHLLKRLAIARATGAAWPDARVTADPAVRNGKPFYAPGGVAFNVSHHGDLVVLVGATRPSARVGIDVVKADLDKDRRALNREGGFVRWLQLFRDMFSAAELRGLAARLPEGATAHGGRTGPLYGDDLLRARLRLFYAHWACKEAYIKLTGDALGADFLRELEFPGVVVPQPAAPADAPGETTTTPVRLRGRLLPDVRIEIQAVGPEYMVATAVQGDDAVPEFERLSLARDVLPWTTAA